MASILVIELGAVCTAQAPPTQTLAPAPGREVQDLTAKPGDFDEPAVAVNPSDPQQVLAAYQDNVFIAYSGDAGRHWKTASAAPKNYAVSGDVSVAYDKHGRAFVCYIAFDKLGTMNYWAHGATRNGIFVRRSLDGGQHWEAEHHAVAEQPTEPGIPFEDKPSIVADASNGPYSGTLYVGWTRWTLTDSRLVLSRSTDAGETWSAPMEIDSHRGLPRDDNGANEGFSGVVGPRSTLYAVWSDGDHIRFTRSRDGGRAFSPARSIITTAPIMFDVQGVARSNGFPVISMDARSGRLYVAWSDYRNGDVDVFCSWSGDRGSHWSPPVRVNSDPVHDGTDQFFHWLAVDPETGAVNLIFYDRRRDPNNRETTVTLARSTDGGRSFRNYAWTDTPFESRGAFMGDYTGIAAWGGRVYGVWAARPNPKAYGDIVRAGVADFNTR